MRQLPGMKGRSPDVSMRRSDDGSATHKRPPVPTQVQIAAEAIDCRRPDTLLKNTSSMCGTLFQRPAAQVWFCRIDAIGSVMPFAPRIVSVSVLSVSLLQRLPPPL
jgi:hypothetical protein